ncbi:LacI family DNA-binding transcriptional regulator [Neobacillus ginsengisoli]|uniref:LacI family transcriptional regulator/LacI family purine nucleotide synthesis repressor n=1 Tax=Neobacillus ginsengisoli TaxID=904295 RepID=A0ABT9XUN0_9BACI|nr:LacI family DNA-binding transcriptional regulator [Neobacillus ginsengisoli]MDQ0199263.1 LacI family transcriptional regulator/LacI family purine nucleotide synthesis repressor [Neobacillus ginsengisoli]
MSYTIKDIALQAGVSKSTVSRVISENGYTSKESREKVLKAIKEMQYKPNGVARAMVSQRTNNIGVIIYRQHHPIASHPFYGKILDAILMTAARLNYSVFVTTDKEMSLISADYMLEKRVDGLILISRLSQEVIGHIDQFNIPYLMVNGTMEKNDVIQIVNHDRKGGVMVADHLYQLGHKNFLVIAGPQEHRSHHLRLQGFLARMNELGCSINQEDIFYSPTSTYEDGYKGLSIIWEQFSIKKPTAIFATNDMLALGAMKALLEKGLKIPEDVAISGFDNIDFSNMFHPPLTTVKVDNMRMGEDAVLLLDQLIKKEQVPPERIEYEPQMIIRKSTK